MSLGLDIPFSIKLSKELQNNRVWYTKRAFDRGRVGERFMRITLEDVEYRYQANTPFEHLALHDVNLSIDIQARIQRLLVIRVQGNLHFYNI